MIILNNLIRLLVRIENVECVSGTIKKDDIYVGIDLGTTNTCVCFFNKATETTEFLNFGDKVYQPTVPTAIYFDQNGHHTIGYRAKELSINKDGAFIYGYKRVNGLFYNNISFIDRFIKDVSYNVVPHKPKDGANDNPIVAFPIPNGEYHTPTTLNILLLRDIYNKLNEKYNVIATVITTPAYFTEPQQAETKLAAVTAGFPDVKIDKEPSAACVDYAQSYMGTDVKVGEKNVLIFDLGGGTFDLSYLVIDNSKDEEAGKNKVFSSIDVLMYRGDNFLGGENVNSLLFNYIQKNIMKKDELSQREKLNLGMFVEKFKIEACDMWREDINRIKESTLVKTDKFFDSLNNEYVISMNESKFNEITESFFNNIKKHFIDPVNGMFRPMGNDVLEKPIDKNTIDLVILVGGATRMPKIPSLIREIFGDKKIEISDVIDADKSVARGAALICANRFEGSGLDSIAMQNTTHLHVGIAVVDGSFKAIIPSREPIPCKFSETFTTVEDYQSKVNLRLAMGVRPRFEDNEFIGQLELKIAKPVPKGQCQIKVEMQMTSDFGLKLNASIEGESENAISHTFKNCYKSLDDELVKKLLKDATLYAEEDKEIEAKFKVKSEFESYLEIYKKRVESVKFNGKENVVHRAYVDTHRDFLLQDKKADSALTSDRLKEELESLKKNLEEFEKLAQESGDKVETDEKKDSDDRRKVEL